PRSAHRLANAHIHPRIWPVPPMYVVLPGPRFRGGFTLDGSWRGWGASRRAATMTIHHWNIASRSRIAGERIRQVRQHSGQAEDLKPASGRRILRLAHARYRLLIWRPTTVIALTRAPVTTSSGMISIILLLHREGRYRSSTRPNVSPHTRDNYRRN